jgi:hypothetical protein
LSILAFPYVRSLDGGEMDFALLEAHLVMAYIFSPLHLQCTVHSWMPIRQVALMIGSPQGGRGVAVFLRPNLISWCAKKEAEDGIPFKY